MAKAGRNDLCPCGSGKKYKRCCALKQQGGGRLSKLMVAVLVAVLAGGVYAAVVGFGEDSSPIASPGQVWSPEHGHYH